VVFDSLLDPLLLLGMGFTGMIDRIVGVFSSAGDTRVLLFGLVIGAMLELMQRSGGVAAFVQSLTGMGLTSSKRRVGILASLTGTILFVESSMSVLSSGVVAQKLFDRFKMSRQRLAFIIDSTSAPVCVLLPANAWGAYVLSLVAEYNLDNPVAVVAGSIPFNFYAILILGMVWYTAFTTRIHGPLARAEEEQELAQTDVSEDPDQDPPTKARYMALPLLVLILGMGFFMCYTGKISSGSWNFFEGSGSLSVLLSVTLACILLVLMLTLDKVFTYPDTVKIAYKGMGKLLPVTMIMLLSFAIGGACRNLGTGPFVASFVGSFLPVFLVAPLLFICGAVISFTTGTSWGTFAILVPLGIPLGMEMGLPPAFVLSAVLGGGVFGDHCSPISDTTLLSSLASGCDHLEHVRTQIPYALCAGSAALLIYMVVGLLL